MSQAGIQRQARRLARMSNPVERLAALDRIGSILEAAVMRQRLLKDLPRTRTIPSKKLYSRKGKKRD